MEGQTFFQKNLLLILIIFIAVIYLIFREQINKYFGIIKNTYSPSQDMSCSTSYYAKLPSGKVYNIWTSDEGTAANPKITYYKQEVILDNNGSNNIGNITTISTEEFSSSCQYFYEPPFEWYTAKSTANTGPNTSIRKSYRAGGIVGGGSGNIGVGFGGMQVISGGYTTNIQSNVELYDKNGTLLNPAPNTKPKKCEPDCLFPHTSPGPYAGYYFCSCEVRDYLGQMKNK